jgi:spore coat polysaccharide biosynthesis protein SpsF (cytidylyltransferase family)
MRWTLDFPGDLEFFRAVFAHLPAGPAVPGYDAVRTVLAKHPEIAAINAHIGDRGRNTLSKA